MVKKKQGNKMTNVTTERSTDFRLGESWDINITDHRTTKLDLSITLEKVHLKGNGNLTLVVTTHEVQW